MVMLALSGLAFGAEISDWEAFARDQGLAETARAVIEQVTEDGVERARMRLAARRFGRIRFPVAAVDAGRFPDLSAATGCSWDTGIQCEFSFTNSTGVDPSRIDARCLDAGGRVVGRPVETAFIGGRGVSRVAARDLEICGGAGGVMLRLSERARPTRPPPPPEAAGDPSSPSILHWLIEALRETRREDPGPRIPTRPGILPGLGRRGLVRYGALIVGLGRDAAGVARILDAHAQALDACYQREWTAVDEPLKMAMELRFTVGRAGTVELPQVRDLRITAPTSPRSSEAGRAVGRCAMASLSRLRFPAGYYAFATVSQEVFFGP